MTGEKIRTVLRYYDCVLAAQQDIPVRRAEHTHVPSGMTYVEGLKILAHCRWMARKAQTFIDEGRVDKAMRWLGFIQGLLYACGEFSITDLKHHNRSETG